VALSYNTRSVCPVDYLIPLGPSVACRVTATQKFGWLVTVLPEIVPQLVSACARSLRLEIQYSSMKTPKGEERVIAPNKLVNSGFRWHVPAYCEKSRYYRDFVLGRILIILGELGERLGPAEHDTS
jgi:hypothetical protein